MIDLYRLVHRMIQMSIAVDWVAVVVALRLVGMDILLKAALAGGVIAFASWLAEKRPDLAGFIVALPLASIIALVITQIQTQNSENAIIFAKSILVGVPLSYLFFVPFFLPQVSRFGFWITLSVGLLLLVIGYFIHQFILKLVA